MKTVLFLAAAIAATGCLSRKPLEKQSFAFDVPPAAHARAATDAPALTLRQISVVPPFDSPSLTYRTGEFSYERDPYSVFLVSPAESLTGPIRALLQNTGKFSTISDTDSSVRANLDLEISVSQLYGDFRQQLQPAAVMEMRFILFRPGERFSRSKNTNVLYQNTYLRRIPLKARTAEAVVAGLNQALNQIVTEFAKDAPLK